MASKKMTQIQYQNGLPSEHIERLANYFWRLYENNHPGNPLGDEKPTNMATMKRENGWTNIPPGFTESERKALDEVIGVVIAEGKEENLLIMYTTLEEFNNLVEQVEEGAIQTGSVILDESGRVH
jgi:hypothetical protein